MNERILIVEDEELIAGSIAFALRHEGFEVDVVTDGEHALDVARSRQPDLVILDLVLRNGVSGFDICRELRSTSAVPIVILSARDSEIDRILGLDRGADDFVAKPFSMRELVARVRAHLNRRELDRVQRVDSVRRIGRLTIDLFHRRVSVDGELVHLTASELKVLELLSERPGREVSRREIVAGLWASDFGGDLRACDAHVARLRRKIERDPARPELIISVRGVGYKLADSVDTSCFPTPCSSP